MSLHFVAVPLFFCIAFFFSMLGVGGSILYVPVLYWLGMDFQTQAIPLGILLNVFNSGTASIAYVRNHLVNWNVAAPFGGAMIIVAPLGAWANSQFSSEPIIFLFAFFILFSAAMILYDGNLFQREIIQHISSGLLIAVGGLVGFLIGLVGRGGGSFVTPILFMLGLDIKIAAATSAIIITGGGLSNFISYLNFSAQADWLFWALCVCSVSIGGRLGSIVMTSRLDSKKLRKIYAALLFLLALILMLDLIFWS